MWIRFSAISADVGLRRLARLPVLEERLPVDAVDGLVGRCLRLAWLAFDGLRLSLGHLHRASKIDHGVQCHRRIGQRTTT